MTPSFAEPPRLLADRYALHEIIGEGRTARVHRATHIETGQRLAIKILRQEYSGDRLAVQRFQDEARRLAALEHRNIIEVLDAGHQNEEHFLVMPLLIGEDLAGMMRREHRLPWSRARDLTLQICDALEHAHARGIVHGDVKPSNCFLHAEDDRPERLKLLDFGCAIDLDLEGRPSPGAGQALGTPAYRAPERLHGEVDARADIYAVGTLLFQMLTGRLPVSDPPGGTAPRMAWFAEDLKFSYDLEDTVARALRRRPDERHADIRTFAAEIRALQQSEKPPVAPQRTAFNDPRSLVAGLIAFVWLIMLCTLASA